MAIPHASTVVLLRDSGAGPETFLMRRHGRSSFMANAYVFPGGRLDPADSEPELVARTERRSPEACHKAFLPTGPRHLDDEAVSKNVAVGLYLAAIREAFEEAGVLLSVADESDPTKWLDHPARTAIHRGELSLLEFSQRNNLRFDLAHLEYFAHWITPKAERKRFNTRFFLASVPHNQRARHDAKETVESLWLTAPEALDRAASGALFLAPPQVRILEDLSAFKTVEDALAWAKAEVPTPIMPTLTQVDGKPAVLLPGDPLNPSSTPVRGHTRMIVKNGRFRSVSPLSCPEQEC